MTNSNDQTTTVTENRSSFRGELFDLEAHNAPKLGVDFQLGRDFYDLPSGGVGGSLFVSTPMSSRRLSADELNKLVRISQLATAPANLFDEENESVPLDFGMPLRVLLCETLPDSKGRLQYRIKVECLESNHLQQVAKIVKVLVIRALFGPHQNH